MCRCTLHLFLELEEDQPVVVDASNKCLNSTYSSLLLNIHRFEKYADLLMRVQPQPTSWITSVVLLNDDGSDFI